VRAENVFWKLGRHPAVALTEDAQEIRAASVDFIEARGQDVPLSIVVIWNAPTKVHFAPNESPLVA
jgi:hypothetical protein